jgi:Cu/Zn superoxide dismutase
MKKIAFVAVAALAALVVTAAALSAPKGTGWSAKLTSAQETPKQVVKNTKAKGAFAATLTGKKLKWKLTFSGLTGPATAAHIHMGAMGKAGGVVVALCGPCKSGQSGTATIPNAVLKAAGKHLLYVNVHTAKNPNGEIRGQLAG